MRVVLLGPPGAGKGTQARFIQEEHGACLVSTGDILRKAVSDRTSLGRKASEYIQKGELAPDTLMIDLVAERLSGEDCLRGFILDGFPRTVAQAEGLEAVLRDRGFALDGVLSLRVPRAAIIQRLAGRRTCRNCGSLYHVIFSPPRRSGVCDRCQGELYQREDDREETVAARLDVYERQTAPLVDYYRKKDLLREIDGAGDVSGVRNHVRQALGPAPIRKKD